MRSRGYHALLVEDNPDHAILIREILLHLREVKQVTLARDGQEALDQLQRMHRLPDFILLDIKLPRIDGFELLKILKSDPGFAQIPVIAVSTSDIRKDREKALALGAMEYLVKPANFDELQEKLQSILARLPELSGTKAHN